MKAKGEGQGQGLNTIKLVLDKFKESRFAANQVDNLFNSLLMY